MNQSLRDLTIEQRLQIVEDLWDSIAEDQQALVLTGEQRKELDRRLESFQLDGAQGRPAEVVIDEIRKRL